MKYIDSDKLIAEIERRMKDYNASIEKYYNKQKSIKAERDSWKWAECKWFLNLIATLQQEQPDVDLEKEIHRFFEECIEVHEIPLYGKVKEGVISVDCYEIIARHFYELGIHSKQNP